MFALSLAGFLVDILRWKKWGSPDGERTVRGALLCLALALGIAKLAMVVHEHYPIQKWLFWRYGLCWLLCLYFCVACLAVGHAALSLLLRDRSPPSEHLVLSFALGVYLFFLGMFLAGLSGIYGPLFFVLWPAALVALGARPLRAFLFPRLQRLRRVRRSERRALGAKLFAVYGLVNLLVLYLAILSPENVTYDARWYHLPIAEQYAAQGAVRPSAEGWYQIALPHLASYLYTWAFLLPRGTLFDCVELSAHLEYTLFLATLASVPVLVRRLVPGISVRGTWAAVFLFHVVILPSNLAVAADNIAAFWAIPTYLALLRALPSLEPRRCALVAVMAAGAMLTKYQAISIAIVPVLAVIGRALWLSSNSLRRREPAFYWFGGPSLAAVVGLCCTMPHWLKNWVWYGDPIYPFLHRHLRLHPWTPDSAALFETVFKDQLWAPTGTTIDKALQTAKALYTFSFGPKDWPHFPDEVPLFGTLFTVSVLLLVFLRKTRRIWLLVAGTHVGIAAWYWTSHQDRYLIALVPWMAATVAATVLLVVRHGWPTRLMLSALVGLETIWGGDALFLPCHPMMFDTPLKASITLIQSGFRKDYTERFRAFQPFDEIGESLAPGSKVLVHELHMHAGLRHASVSDWGGWQGGISYGRMQSPRALYDFLQQLGVTHVLWEPGKSQDWDSLAGDLMFFDFVTRSLADAKRFGKYLLAAMPQEPPSDGDFRSGVAVFGCENGSYESGTYRVSDLRVRKFGPQRRRSPTPRDPEPDPGALSDDIGFVVVDRSCRPQLAGALRPTFTRAARRGTTEVWIRKADGRTARHD